MHSAIWLGARSASFLPAEIKIEGALASVFLNSITTLKRLKGEGTLYDAEGKITQFGMNELGRAGWWGVLVPTEYGGSGATFTQFTKLVTDMAAAGFPTEAGIAGMHGCIGAVSSITRCGTDEQKARWLPLFAAGQHTSGFALTEKGAGSDLSAIATTARLEGDEYVVNGEKFFNGNCIPTRIIRLVAKVEGEDKLGEFIVELPEENENFSLIRYKIHAVIQGRNNGLKFTNFRVPAKNRIVAPNGNTLASIYSGLNYGRVAVGSTCAGVLRLHLASVCPWAEYRETFGAAIKTRETVKNGIARLAALIVGADALRDRCAQLLDNGGRGELECIIAKVFTSKALKEGAFDIAMNIHGGRSFLDGHLLGRNFGDHLAPCIYEGQNDMLLMKFFAVLAKEHGMEQLLPLGNGLKDLKKGKLLSGAKQVLSAGLRLAGWKVKNALRRVKGENVRSLNSRLEAHYDFAQFECASLAAEISACMSKHGAKLADRQSRIVHLSQKVLDVMLILFTVMHAHAASDEGTAAAADILCQDLTRKLTGAEPSDEYFADCVKLADMVLAGKFKQLDGTERAEVLRPYKN